MIKLHQKVSTSTVISSKENNGQNSKVNNRSLTFGSSVDSVSFGSDDKNNENKSANKIAAVLFATGAVIVGIVLYLKKHKKVDINEAKDAVKNEIADVAKKTKKSAKKGNPVKPNVPVNSTKSNPQAEKVTTLEVKQESPKKTRKKSAKPNNEDNSIKPQNVSTDRAPVQKSAAKSAAENIATPELKLLEAPKVVKNDEVATLKIKKMSPYEKPMSKEEAIQSGSYFDLSGVLNYFEKKTVSEQVQQIAKKEPVLSKKAVKIAQKIETAEGVHKQAVRTNVRMKEFQLSQPEAAKKAKENLVQSEKRLADLQKKFDQAKNPKSMEELATEVITRGVEKVESAFSKTGMAVRKVAKNVVNFMGDMKTSFVTAQAGAKQAKIDKLVKEFQDLTLEKNALKKEFKSIKDFYATKGAQIKRTKGQMVSVDKKMEAIKSKLIKMSLND